MEVGVMTPGEGEAVIDLWKEAGLTRPWNDPNADLSRALGSPCAEVFVVRDMGALIGTVMVGHDGHRGWVYYLGVAGNARGRGVGRALMRAAESWVRAQGIARLNLMVRHSNEAARGFYDSIGYALSEVVVLQKDLTVG